MDPTVAAGAAAGANHFSIIGLFLQADMVVKTTYSKETGKSYQIVSQSGPALWRNEVLGTLLDNEKRMSQPGNVGTALINSANYEMKLDANPHEQLEQFRLSVFDTHRALTSLARPCHQYLLVRAISWIPVLHGLSFLHQGIL